MTERMPIRSFTLRPETWERLEALANRQGVSRSSIVEKALAEHLEGWAQVRLQACSLMPEAILRRLAQVRQQPLEHTAERFLAECRCRLYESGNGPKKPWSEIAEQEQNELLAEFAFQVVKDMGVAAIMGYRTPFGVRFRREGEQDWPQGTKGP